ncbi:MAG: PL29 family lyase N-terminal domain-containing protein [Candidatus Cryptobacteroides sp.]
MKLNKIVSLFSAAALLFSAAGCADLTELENRLDNLESRVKAIETQLPALNANIEALAELAGGATINSVELKDGVYTITLTNGDVITLTQGSIGVANAPVMSVDKDGYWMVDYGSGATYVLKDGQKVKATGDNGVTPIIGVDAEGYWTVSYDGGATYERVKGADGQPVPAVPSEGADEYFTDVKTDEDGNLVITMKNGESLVVPVLADFLFSIEADGLQVLQAGETRIFNVTSKGVASAAIVATPSGVEATLAESSLTVRALASTKATADSRTDVAVLALSKAGYAALAKLQVKVEGAVAPDTTPKVTLAAGEATTSSLTFSVALDNADSYKYILTDGEAPDAAKVIAEGTESSEATLTVTGLAPETEYTLYVVAIGEKENSALASIKSKTLTPAPAIEAGVKSVATFSATITVVLSDAPSFKYLVVKDEPEASVPSLEQLTEEGTAGELVVEGLEANTAYVLYISAVNGSYSSGVLSLKFTTTDYANIYERYMDGKDLKFGDIVINKATHGDATLITAASENKVLESVGVYFIDPAVEDASLKADAEKLVVASLTDERVLLTRAGQCGITATAEDDFIILANVIYKTTQTSGNVFGCKGDGEIETVAFYNVGVEVPKDMNLLYNGGKNILNIYMDKCDVKLHEGTTERNLFQFNTSHTFESIVFRNNVIWSCDGDRAGFRFVSAQNCPVTSLEISNNTVAGVYCKATSGYVTVKNAVAGTVKLNMFLVENYTANVADKYTGIIWITNGSDESGLDMPANLAYYGESIPTQRMKVSYYTSNGTIYNKTAADGTPVPSPDYTNGVFTTVEPYLSYGAKR